MIKNALTRSIFELEKCSFFKWVRLSPKIDWYHYQGAKSGTYVYSPASNNDKDPYEVKCHIRGQKNRLKKSK